MFSGDMLLNPQIFGRAQPPKRSKSKSKRSHMMHQKKPKSTTMGTKIGSISSVSSKISSPNKHSHHHHSQKYAKSLSHTNRISKVAINRKQIISSTNNNSIKTSNNMNIHDMKESINNINQSPDIVNINNKNNINKNIDDKDDKDDKNNNNNPQRYKVKMNFVDNKHIFTNKDNENRTPLPGSETKQDLKNRMLNDEYYVNVICNGQIPSKEIFIGLFYLLLILSINAYIQILPISITIATIFILILFIQTKPTQTY